MSLGLVLAMTVLALIASAPVLLPLLRGPRRQASRREHDLEVYRDQLAELDRDVAAERIGRSQAAAARAEIERRVLRIADGETEAGDPSAASRLPRAAVLGLGLAIPAIATAIYLTVGSPGMPDVPHASRATADAVQVAEREEFQRLTDRLADRLEAGEGDLMGWIMLARSYRTLGRTEESIVAFRRAIELAGGSAAAPPELLEDFGEALFLDDGGQVTAEAGAAFREALRREPHLFKARHYLAVGYVQSGETARALAIWRGIEADSPAGAPWLPELRQRIDRLAAELGVDPGEIPPERMASDIGAAGFGAVAEGPTHSEAEAAADMSPEERAAFVRGMVERLAARLEESPDDAEGWARLARAYAVLGEPGKAEEARRNAVGQLRGQLDSLPAGSPEREALETRLKSLESPS